MPTQFLLLLWAHGCFSSHTPVSDVYSWLAWLNEQLWLLADMSLIIVIHLKVTYPSLHHNHQDWLPYHNRSSLLCTGKQVELCLMPWSPHCALWIPWCPTPTFRREREGWAWAPSGVTKCRGTSDRCVLQTAWLIVPSNPPTAIPRL